MYDDDSRYVRTDAIHSTQSSAPQGSSPRLAQLHVRTVLQVSSKEDSDDQHVPSLLNASGTSRYAACHIPPRGGEAQFSHTRRYTYMYMHLRHTIM